MASSDSRYVQLATSDEANLAVERAFDALGRWVRTGMEESTEPSPDEIRDELIAELDRISRGEKA